MKKSTIIILLLIVIIVLMMFRVGSVMAFTSLQSGITTVNINGIRNNTLLSKAYINGTLYATALRVQGFNITYSSSGTTFYPNSSGGANGQVISDSEPSSYAGCFRINAGTGANSLPGGIHLGSGCAQGWPGSYIDINDPAEVTSNNARLLAFIWKNTGPGSGNGLNMNMQSRAASTTDITNTLAYTGPGTSATARMISNNIGSLTTNNSLPSGRFVVLDITTNSPNTNALTRPNQMVIVSGVLPNLANRYKSFIGLDLRAGSASQHNTTIGIAMPNLPRTAGALANKYNGHSWIVLSTGFNNIQLAGDSRYFYNGPKGTTAWENVTLANVSTGYDYFKNILYTEFVGRTAGDINTTVMSKRQYNLSFAGGVRINQSLSARNYTLSNGSGFDIIYGRDANNQTLANGLIKNNTALGKVYINGSIYANNDLNIANLLVVDNNNLNIWLNATTRIYGYGGLLLIKSSHVGDTSYMNYSISGSGGLLELGGALNQKIKVKNLTVGNITTRRYFLNNGSSFDGIYGRTNQTLAKGLIKNNTASGKEFFNATNGFSFKLADATSLESGNKFNIFGSAGRRLSAFILDGVGIQWEGTYGEMIFNNSLAGNNVAFVSADAFKFAVQGGSGIIFDSNKSGMWIKPFPLGYRNQTFLTTNLSFYTYSTASGGRGKNGIPCTFIMGGNTSSYCNTLVNNTASLASLNRIQVTSLKSSYTGGSAYVCVNDDGILSASETVC